jgi:hypothetical protein
MSSDPENELPIRVQVHWLMRALLNSFPMVLLLTAITAYRAGVEDDPAGLLSMAGMAAIGMVGAVLSWS